MELPGLTDLTPLGQGGFATAGQRQVEEAWLARDGHAPPLRRLVAEGRDGVVRALRARVRDARD